MKVFEVVSLTIVFLLGSWLAYGLVFESGVDTPKFDLIKQTKQFSIRYYDKLALASVQSGSENASFRTLFRFIDGANSLNTKIAMTAPVITDEATMMFVLPEALTTPPTPTNSNVTLKTMTGLKVAVISFSGSSAKADKFKKKLRAYLDAEAIPYTNNWLLCQYNSPWVFPLLRKNEVWVELLDN